MLLRFVGLLFLLELFVAPLRVVCFCVIEPLRFDGPGCSWSLLSAKCGQVSCWTASFRCSSSFSRDFCSSK